MLFLAIILTLCVVLAGVFAWLYSRSTARLPTPPQFRDYLGQGPDRYRHLDRLFSGEDFGFLDRTPAGRRLLPRLRNERCQLLREILAEIRVEFESLLSVGSMLATSSAARDDQFGATLVRETLRFYAVYAWLWMYSYWPWAGPGGYLPSPLLQQIRNLREGTRQLMAALTPGDMDRLRETILGRP